MGEVKFNVQIDTYKERLEECIIAYLAELRRIAPEEAMDIYYRSRLSRQIDQGLFGIENMDYKYLANDLVENEPNLFTESAVDRCDEELGRVTWSSRR